MIAGTVALRPTRWKRSPAAPVGRFREV